MFGGSDIGLFAQSLNGYRRSRIELYKRLILTNPRVLCLRSSYPDLDDFLHDSFSNLLRTGHAFNMEGNWFELVVGSARLSDWVESVAAWTALERERSNGINRLAARGFVRMCLVIEKDGPTGRSPLASYVPPRSGPEDSLSSRIAGLVGEPQNTLLRARAIENAAWEDAAAAAGRPVKTIGPILVRAVDRLSRFFGAPPLLNADLEPVLADVPSEEADAEHSHRLKPIGRVISMQLDTLFYEVTPEMREIGLTDPAEVRTIQLWDAARMSEPCGATLLGHLGQCHYCSDVLRSLRLMQQALLGGASAGFALCPNVAAMLKDPDRAEEPLRRHLEECAPCRDERTRVLSGEVLGNAGQRRITAGAGFGRKIAWVAAAAVILGGVFFYFTTRTQVTYPSAKVTIDKTAVKMGREIQIRTEGAPRDWSGDLLVRLSRHYKLDSKLYRLRATVENGFSTYGPTDLYVLLTDSKGREIPVANNGRFHITVIPCAVRLDQASRTADPQGLSSSIRVTARDGYKWSVGGVPDWITIASGASGSGSGTVFYKVSANTANDPRSATLMLGDAIFEVSQPNPPEIQLPFKDAFRYSTPPPPMRSFTSDEPTSTRWYYTGQTGRDVAVRINPGDGPQGANTLIVNKPRPYPLSSAIQLVLPAIAARQGAQYQVSAWMKAQNPGPVLIGFRQRSSPYGSCGLAQTFMLSRDWAEYKVPFRVSGENCDASKNGLIVEMGRISGAVWIANFSMVPSFAGPTTR